MDASQGSASFFARVSRDLMELREERPTLQSVVERAVEVVPACDWASITLRRRRNRMETVAASSEVAEAVDQLQYDLHRGPTDNAVRTGEVRLYTDLAHSETWPVWGPQAAALGVHAVLGVQLSTSEDVLGALNFYAGRSEDFSPEDVDLAVIYATHAANALSAARMATGLQTALDTRHAIGVAQGILMRTYQLDMEQAFELLRRYSSHTNTKMAEIAQYVVANGELPEHDTPHG